MIDIPENSSKEEVKVLLKACDDGEHGVLATEVKVTVLSFQEAPPGMCPYVVLAGIPQTTNESNDFAKVCMDACKEAAKQVGNLTIANSSTDGVACEVEGNKQLTCAYLRGEENQVSLPDPNHNVKNLRYQLGGGSSPASIGEHVFDPQMLKISGIATELWRIDDYASDALPLRLASASSVEKIVESDFDDIGNLAVTVLSLVFMRLRSYAANARVLPWKQRAIYTWATLLWFTSFHCPGSTMLANKRNMLLESIGLLFLFPRSDVLHPRRLTSECNEHTYGFWRMMLREFNVEQIIRIVDRSNIRLEAIFASNLVTARSHTSFKGYQQTFPEFLKTLKQGSAGATPGPVHVDNDKPAVDQLWDEVKGVIEVVNSWMLPFLKVFGVEEGNGLSPFAVAIEKPSDLLALVEQFFKPPKRDKRGNSTLDDDDVAEDVDLLEEEDLVEEVSQASNGVNSLPVGVLEHHVNGIRQSASDESIDDDLILDDDEDDATTATEEASNETFFEAGAQSSAFDHFKRLMRCSDIAIVPDCALDLIKLVDLGKLEKGAMSSAAHFKSRNGRWFSQKKTSGDTAAVDEASEALITIQRDSLIQVKCKRGRAESVENYRVLALFSKYYNKWFVSLEDSFPWTGNPSAVTNARVLVRMVKKQAGSNYKEVTLEAGGDWGPKQVFCVVNYKDIIGVDNQLVEV